MVLNIEQANLNASVGCGSSSSAVHQLKVSAKTSPASAAGAIAGLIKDKRVIEIHSVGAGAVNQAIKSIAIARGFLVPIGIDICALPSFNDIEIDGQHRTAIKITVCPFSISSAISNS